MERGIQGLVICKTRQICYYRYRGIGLAAGKGGASGNLGGILGWNVFRPEDYEGVFVNASASGGNLYGGINIAPSDAPEQSLLSRPMALEGGLSFGVGGVSGTKQDYVLETCFNVK